MIRLNTDFNTVDLAFMGLFWEPILDGSAWPLYVQFIASFPYGAMQFATKDVHHQ